MEISARKIRGQNNAGPQVVIASLVISSVGRPFWIGLSVGKFLSRNVACISLFVVFGCLVISTTWTSKESTSFSITPGLFGITGGMLCGLKSKLCSRDYCGCCKMCFLIHLKRPWIVRESQICHPEEGSFKYPHPLSVNSAKCSFPALLLNSLILENS